jgi:hypothetical protein
MTEVSYENEPLPTDYPIPLEKPSCWGPNRLNHGFSYPSRTITKIRLLKDRALPVPIALTAASQGICRCRYVPLKSKD